MSDPPSFSHAGLRRGDVSNTADIFSFPKFCGGEHRAPTGAAGDVRGELHSNRSGVRARRI